MNKVSHYRIAVFDTDSSTNVLANKLNAGFARIDVDAKGIAVLSYADGLECLIRRTSPTQNSNLFHFVIYEENSRAAVISLTEDLADIKIGEVAPNDENDEFIKSQLFLYVQGNDVLYVTHNNAIRDGGINALLLSLANNGLKATEHSKFFILKAGNKQELKAIFEKGIEYIDLGLGTFSEALDYLKQDGKLEEGIFKSIFSKDQTADQEKALSDVKVGLVIKPSRRWKKNRVKELLSSIAVDIEAEHDDDFTIQMKDGPRITQSRLLVKKTIHVTGNSRILNVVEVGARLSEALAALKQEKLVE